MRILAALAVLLLAVTLAWGQGGMSPGPGTHHSAASAAPTFDAATTSTSASFSHTCAGSNRLLMVAIANDAGDSFQPGAPTYNGISMTSVGAINNATDFANVRLTVFRLIAPATGSNTLAFSIGPVNFVVVAVSFNGVNQTTPLGTAATATGTTAAQPSVTVSSAVNDLVFDAIGTLNSAADTFTAGTGQTKRASVDNGADIGGASSTEAGAASVVMDWSSPNRYWSSVGVSIKP